jgi:hypothetical protein
MGALRELHGYLEAQGVQASTCEIGAAFLALARARGWNENSEAVRGWLEELALDVAKQWHSGEVAASPPLSQSEVETVPLSELKKMLKPGEATAPKSDEK